MVTDAAVPSLIAACLDGDESGWEKLIKTYAGLINGVAARYGLAEHDRADVFQSVCVELWRNLKHLRDPERLPGWLATVTARHSAQQIRRHVVQREAGGGEAQLAALMDAALSAEDRLLLEERWASLRQAVQRLDASCRQLIHALFFDPDCPSYEAVAQRLAMPKNSVGPTRLRCFGKLRGILLNPA